MARRGEAVELAARPIRIDEIEVVSYEWPTLVIRVTCGKGTYIRSLGRDIGSEMGVGGVLTALRRTRVGRFSIEDSLTLEALPDPMDPWSLTLDPALFDDAE
jgi:tRNA pseudouridine55 synthase